VCLVNKDVYKNTSFFHLKIRKRKTFFLLLWNQGTARRWNAMQYVMVYGC